MYPLLPIAGLPMPGFKLTRRPRTQAVQYSEGFEDEEADGINTDDFDVEIKLGPLTRDEKADVVDFLRGLRGYGICRYQMIGESAEMLFKVSKWSSRQAAHEQWDVSMTLTRRFAQFPSRA